MMKQTLLKRLWPTLFLILFLCYSSIAQQLTRGLLMPGEGGKMVSCCLLLPKEPLSVYGEPGGKKIGELVPEFNELDKAIYQASFIVGEQTEKVEWKDQQMVGYETMAMVYLDHQNGFLQLTSGHWLAESEVSEKGLVVTTWMDYVVNAEDVLGWYANDPGLNLRSEPSVSGEKIVTLSGDLWEIEPTGEVQGLWCKVTAKLYEVHPCDGGEAKVLRTLTGWVKILSDEQTLNVWEYTKGC